MKLMTTVVVVTVRGGAALALPVAIYFGSSWNAVAEDDVAAFRSERDAAQEGSLYIETAPAISVLKAV